MSSAHFVPILLLVGIFAWSIYRRVRRNIGRQPLHPRRAITSITILSLVTVLIVGTSLQNANLLLGFGGGILLGALLGFVGLKLSRFETTDEGHFYTPNTYIGVALSVLFVGRVAYQIYCGWRCGDCAKFGDAVSKPADTFHPGAERRLLPRLSNRYIDPQPRKKQFRQKGFASAGSKLELSRDRPRSDPEKRGISRQKKRRVAAPSSRASPRASVENAAHEIVSEF